MLPSSSDEFFEVGTSVLKYFISLRFTGSLVPFRYEPNPIDRMTLNVYSTTLLV
jgi:hypothetical protein